MMDTIPNWFIFICLIFLPVYFAVTVIWAILVAIIWGIEGLDPDRQHTSQEITPPSGGSSGKRPPMVIEVVVKK
jgi:hypothetical protein